MRSGSAAATSAPNASTRMISVSGSSCSSPRRVSRVLSVAGIDVERRAAGEEGVVLLAVARNGAAPAVRCRGSTCTIIAEVSPEVVRRAITIAVVRWSALMNGRPGASRQVTTSRMLGLAPQRGDEAVEHRAGVAGIDRGGRLRG